MQGAITEATDNIVPTPIERLILNYLPRPGLPIATCVCYICQVTNRLYERQQEQFGRREEAKKIKLR